MFLKAPNDMINDHGNKLKNKNTVKSIPAKTEIVAQFVLMVVVLWGKIHIL